MEIIDVSVPLRAEMPTWPHSEGLKLTPAKRMAAGDTTNSSVLRCDVHVGTHVDAPWHFLEDGYTVEQLPLEVLIGPAFAFWLWITVASGNMWGLFFVFISLIIFIWVIIDLFIVGKAKQPMRS